MWSLWCSIDQRKTRFLSRVRSRHSLVQLLIERCQRNLFSYWWGSIGVDFSYSSQLDLRLLAGPWTRPSRHAHTFSREDAKLDWVVLVTTKLSNVVEWRRINREVERKTFLINQEDPINRLGNRYRVLLQDQKYHPYLRKDWNNMEYLKGHQRSRCRIRWAEVALLRKAKDDTSLEENCKHSVGADLSSWET